jgi:carboxypeptidase T
MKNQISFCLVYLICLSAVFAQTPEKALKVRIDLQGKNIHDLASLGIEADHGVLHEGHDLTLELYESELNLIQSAGFNTTVLIPDLQAWYLEHNKVSVLDRNGTCASPFDAYPTPENYTYGSMGGYHTLNEMLTVLDDMRTKFPSLMSEKMLVSDTILTHEGRPLWYVRISKNPDIEENEPKVLYTALHHAREPNSMSQMLFFMWYLLENYATNTEIQYILDNEALYFIPCLNPDGYEFNRINSPNGGGLWRKNRRNNGDNTFGVDLNRNYGFFWGNDNSGSSPNTNSATYRGPAPFSEPETRMLRDFAVSNAFELVQNYHTSGNLLIYPWAYSDSPADSIFVKWSRMFIRENQFKAGTTSETVGYAVNGDSNDWMYAETGAYAFTPEVGTTGFWPLFSEIDKLNKSCVWQNMATALVAIRTGIAEDKSDPFYSTTQFQLPVRLTRFGLKDGPLTLSLEAGTPEIESISGAQVFDLQNFESATTSFLVNLSPNTPVGTKLYFYLHLNNGFYNRTDTLVKYYGGIEAIAFSDTLTSIQAWTGDWGLTDEYFVTAPSSMTDSPNSTYAPNSFTTLQLQSYIQVPTTAVRPQLRFKLRYVIDNSDYAQVRILNEAGEETPLCGQYTKTGRAWQDLGQPVYYNEQFEWVEECMDLSGHTDQLFQIMFILKSNATAESDGIYVDDLSVVYTDPLTLNEHQVKLPALVQLQSQPNPSNQETSIKWGTSGTLSGKAKLLIYNGLGEIVEEKEVDLAKETQCKVVTAAWPAGVYSYQLVTGIGLTTPQKLVVVR